MTTIANKSCTAQAGGDCGSAQGTRTVLLPCPFCGGPADFEQITGSGSGFATWSVGCQSSETDCIGYQMLAHFNRKCEAAEAWNKRAPTPPSSEPVAWIVERASDPTFPRLYKTKSEADAMVAHVTVRPPATARPLDYAHPQPPAGEREAFYADEMALLRAQVEYWRLAAERRDNRLEMSGVDVPEARTLDTPEACDERAAFEKAWAKRPWVAEEESDKDRAWRWWNVARTTPHPPVRSGLDEWKAAPDILLDQVASVRDEYAKTRRDMLDQMEFHAYQRDSEETSRYSTEAERYGMAHLAACRIFKLINEFRSSSARAALKGGGK